MLAVETTSLKCDRELSSPSRMMTEQVQYHLLPLCLVGVVCGHWKEEKRWREEKRREGKLGGVCLGESGKEEQGKWTLPADHPLLEMRLKLEGVVT